MDHALGVKSPAKAKLFAVVSPAPLKPRKMALKCSTHAAKNWPLGHGLFKISGNYGPLLPTLVDARANGFDNVLWMLDNYVKELTT